MAQQQPTPQQAFSPPQPSPSPAASQAGLPAPPNKRVLTEGTSPQPMSPYAASPYAQSPYTGSPAAGGTPPLGAGSPTFAQTPPAPGAYATPYTNGHNTPNLNLPDTRNASISPTYAAQPSPQAATQALPQTSGLASPQPQQLSTPGVAQYQSTSPNPANQQLPAGQNQGVMGPPQRPADRPTKDYEYDVTDSLAGTGIDLRAEEQYMSELYSNALDGNAEARTGFQVQQPGTKATVYGAGNANQPGESVEGQTQDEFAAKAAERAWQESSVRLASSRTQEINDPFLLVAIMHRRADKIARENHIGLNLELKASPAMGRMRPPDQFPSPAVTVKMKPTGDATMVETSGSFIPHEAFLVDQLALLSIAAKQRLRELVEDANVVAINRQKTSHGDVPQEWASAAAPMNREQLPSPPAEENEDASGTALKRPSSAVNGDSKAPPAKLPRIASYLTITMREAAKQERELEEARLRRRQRRRDGGVDSATPSRSNSIAPGTPGSVAPEERNMTKKETKKAQAQRIADASSHANQNMTSSMFAGMGGRTGLFGKKKKNKTYDWMKGSAGSGASTPTKTGGGGGGGMPGPNGTPGTPTGGGGMTTEGRNRLGTWREDKEKGKNIQLRDWVTVLERDGREHKALQRAYMKLDFSSPR